MRIYSHASTLSMTSNTLRRVLRLNIVVKSVHMSKWICCIVFVEWCATIDLKHSRRKTKHKKGARKSRIAHLPFTREFAIFPASRNCHPIDFYNNVMRWICFCFLHSTRWLQPIFSFANLWHTFRSLSTMITQFCIIASTFEWFRFHRKE